MTVLIEMLTKRIGGATVLDDISMEIPAGFVVGLSGANGSGKTMLMRAMAGLIRPTSGNVMVDGKRLWRDTPFPPNAGLLIENPAFLDSRTGRDNLRLLAMIKRGARFDGNGGVDGAVSTSLRRVGLDPFDKRKYRKYSLGMKQRLGIAASVIGKPSLILLDEPSNALDVAGISMLRDVVCAERDRGATIVLACHDLLLLRELSDTIYYMSEGRIVGQEKVEGCRHV